MVRRPNCGSRGGGVYGDRNFFSRSCRDSVHRYAGSEGMNRRIPVGRGLRTAMTGLSSVAARGLVGITSLITIPLMLRHLGAERFGLWMSIVSLPAILSIADFGLGNSLLNAVAVAFGKGDEGLIWRSIRTALSCSCLLSSAIAAAFET